MIQGASEFGNTSLSRSVNAFQKDFKDIDQNLQVENSLKKKHFYCLLRDISGPNKLISSVH